MTIWVVAGEPSGDARAFELVSALRVRRSDISFCGAGGPRLQTLAQPPFDNWIERSAVVGLWDVLRQYGYFHQKFHSMLRAIRHMQPAAVILVDYPGFNLRLAARLRREHFPGKIIQYISPQVWAWNRARIKKMARILDLMVCMFPFEQPMYEASGLHSVFVGHPLLEALESEKHPHPRDQNLVGLFPGSRWREVRRIFPIQLAAARIISSRSPATRFEVSVTTQHHANWIQNQAGDFPLDVKQGTAHDLMMRASAGIVCSGTATLEAAFFRLPYCLIYKTAWLTYEIGKRVVDVTHLGIINILNNYRTNPPPHPGALPNPAPPIIREFIQKGARPAAIASEVLRLLHQPEYAAKMQSEFSDILSGLKPHGASGRAADEILRCLEEK